MSQREKGQREQGQCSPTRDNPQSTPRHPRDRDSRDRRHHPYSPPYRGSPDDRYYDTYHHPPSARYERPGYEPRDRFRRFEPRRNERYDEPRYPNDRFNDRRPPPLDRHPNERFNERDQPRYSNDRFNDRQQSPVSEHIAVEPRHPEEGEEQPPVEHVEDSKYPNDRTSPRNPVPVDRPTRPQPDAAFLDSVRLPPPISDRYRADRDRFVDRRFESRRLDDRRYTGNNFTPQKQREWRPASSNYPAPISTFKTPSSPIKSAPPPISAIHVKPPLRIRSYSIAEDQEAEKHAKDIQTYKIQEKKNKNKNYPSFKTNP